MKTYIGAENIISPLGNTANENFNQLLNSNTGVQLQKEIGFNKESLYLSKLPNKTSFIDLLCKCLNEIQKETKSGLISHEDTIVIISTTKADIEEHISTPINNTVQQLITNFDLKNEPLVVSNACISGVIAMNTANNYIKAGIYKHAFVIGADVLSDFILYGFQSLYAISNERCKPFDKERKGINLGEGAGGVLMSCDNSSFSNECFEFVEGTSSNDANHISGPSRTGEGLYRTIKQTMELGNVSLDEIDFISGHGTATNYNDEMESIAFDRLSMNDIPLNSLKGYFGHTLGAAGLIESAISLQSMRNNTLIKSEGYTEQGTSKTINILTEHTKKPINTVLKSASGFGGCNASAIFRKLS